MERWILRGMNLSVSIFAFVMMACGGSDGGSRGGAVATAGLVNAQPVTITGTLSIDPDHANKDTLVENQSVQLEDGSGKVIASGVSDSTGNFTVSAPGELIVNVSGGLIGGDDYRVTSVIGDDGEGKVLGVSQAVSLTKANIKDGVIKAGVLAFEEIAAITGIIKFVDADGTENTKLPKIGTDVYLPGFSLIAKTDSAGKFLILYVPSGSYTLRIERGSIAKDLSVSVASNTTLNLGTVTVLADSIPPITSASKAATDFKNDMCVTLTASESGSQIYYSTDGSTPTASNPFLYDPSQGGACGDVNPCALCVSGKSTTLKYFAVDPSGNTEDLKSIFYFYNEKWADPADTTAPTTSLSVNAATPSTPAVYLTPPTVSLASSEAGTTYYTLDPGATLTNFTVYEDPFAVPSTSTLRWYSRDYAGNVEAIKSKELKVYSWTKVSSSGPNVSKTNSGSDFRLASMTYDASRSKFIMGTYHGSNDTFYIYRWSGSAWVQETSQASLFAVKFMNFQLYYNTDFQKVYITAPVVSGSLVYGTWDYDSTGPSITSRSSGGSASWDDATYNSFGGTAGVFSPLDHSFVSLAPVNGSSKLQRLYMDPANATSTTAYQSSAQTSLIKDVTAAIMGRAVYVSKSGAEKMIFFGGSSGGHGITYELPRAQFLSADSSATDPTWTENLTTHTPPVGCPELAYLASQDKVIAFGGHNSPVSVVGGALTTSFPYSATDQTWSYDGSDWTLLEPSASPTARYCATSAYDPTTESILLFGGLDRYGNVLTDTWVFSY
ncbi:chitobiase/beta-hexosaminidase C-terminal domain-containing protein [Oligoflexus tunisiensis]|uniref:chitobiase/beta-hexosaminidase C-terminal domain-containing protein n=1 Tax=Oligoflexus tunisiensis TaxID=708132 RepID=UPI00159F247A|nr:chitobiase/beta-hexosaminidase C-terminal domain-containing protein [Oligoflexus tunisiensis]